MSEKHLDRLNYFNGKRLAASDLKLEQEYHIRVRRWLNKSLYSAGIARGLEVREEPGAPVVIVSPGLALDGDGREIILLDEVRLPVRGLASVTPCGGPKGEGSYLVIRYDEAVTGEEGDGCCAPCDTSLAWGGPARVRAEPVLRWVDALPVEGGPDVLLAQVSLKTGCAAVQSIDAGVRRYIGAASMNKVKQFALEGVRDVHWHPTDAAAHQRIYFHIRGRQPSAVTLYLRGEKLPSLYYSEMGAHNHALSVSTQPSGRHRHAVGNLTTNVTGAHDHLIASNYALPDLGNFLADIVADIGNAIVPGSSVHRLAIVARQHWEEREPNGRVVDSGDVPPAVTSAHAGDPRVLLDGAHSHTLSANQLTVSNDPNSEHVHGVSSSATPAGVTDPVTNGAYTARTGAPLTYAADLEIWIDDIDYTADIKQQLKESLPAEQAHWDRIGSGAATHPFVTLGTRAIKLDFLHSFGEGEHWIDLRVPTKFTDGTTAQQPNGGRVNYNLYVE